MGWSLIGVFGQARAAYANVWIYINLLLMLLLLVLCSGVVPSSVWLPPLLWMLLVWGWLMEGQCCTTSGRV